MIQWLFDKRNKYGFLPNLIKDETLEPNTKKWWDLCIQPPFSYEFRFLKYCKLDGIVTNCTLVSDYITGSQSAYYPINLNFFDPTIDYISLMDPYSRQRLIQGDFRLLFYYSEGDNPNPEINNSIDKLCAKYNIPKNAIRFVIANYKLKGKNPFVYFPDDEVYYRYLHVIENNYVKKHNLNRREKKFTCLIRANKIWRKIYASYLHQLNIYKQGFFSFTGYNYETSHIGLDDISKWQGYDESLPADILSFEMQTPFTVDELTDADHNNHKLINKKFFTEAYFSYIVETHFDNDTIFLTEKTFKSILNLQPFIIIGNPGSLRLLKDLGYKTFSEVIKEDYDQLFDHKDRMSQLLKSSFDLCNLSHTHHIRIQSILSQTLQHNQRLFLSPKTNRINQMLKELEY
tara:strand:- start:4248 stop:5453 length:1206 start_codon:yes stop_codon:yes gene_type:complete